jgi:hypothetical protein
LYIFLGVVVAAAVVAVALLLRRTSLPGFVTLGYLVGVLLGLLAYYPFRQLM